MNVDEQPSDVPSVSAATEHEAIARRAYEIWEREGCVEGDAERHWREAEREVRGLAASEGNPANPSLETRENMVSDNLAKDEPVRKIPADALHRHGS